jgi:ribosomal RNA-processing protein 7
LNHATLLYPSKVELLASVDTYMTSFNARQEVEARALAKKRQEVDADGFITVTRGGRNPAARMEDAQEHLRKQEEKEHTFNDFYRFQGREARKEKAAQLVRKFEEDKEKIRKMKVARKSFRVCYSYTIDLISLTTIPLYSPNQCDR